MDHLVRGAVVQDQRDGFGVVEPFRHLYPMLRAAHDVGRVAAVHEERRDAITQLQPSHASAEGIHVTHGFVARQGRILGIGSGGVVPV